MPLTRAGGAVSPDNGRRKDQNSRIRSTWGLLAIGEVQISSHRKNSGSLSKLNAGFTERSVSWKSVHYFEVTIRKEIFVFGLIATIWWSCDVSNYPELASWKLAIANSGIVDIK
jgi:hypothetical protein